MGKVDDKRLKGNAGALYVSALLSNDCLVRPVAADTDIGLDLYCESVQKEEPFLHFWMQVKAGRQCRVLADGSGASCSLDVKDLDYWWRQPVPVFAAMVPSDSPYTSNTPVYVVDITRQLLDGRPSHAQKTLTLRSDYVWRPGEPKDVKEFLHNVVPVSVARLWCRDGVMTKIPTLQPLYENRTPLVPVSKYADKIQTQLRRTAATSLLFLHRLNELNKNQEFRRRLARIVEQFDDDPHWENFMSRALSHHADEEFDNAARMYERAIQVIKNDQRVRDKPEWKSYVDEIEQLKRKAEAKEPVVGSQMQNPPLDDDVGT